MASEHSQQVQKIVDESYIYYGTNQPEPIIISQVHRDEYCFYGCGKRSGDYYGISFDAVDLDNDLFYTLTKVNVE